MNVSPVEIEDAEFDLLRNYIRRTCGISLGDDKRYLVVSRLRPLLAEKGCRSFGEFYTRFAAGNDVAMRNRIVDAMTTNETLWFRDGFPWVALRDEVLPALEHRLVQGETHQLRIWSAACSTGQEPYTIAMVVDDYCTRSRLLRPSNVEIIATDISPAALFVARSGRYDSVSMSRGLTDQFATYRTRYFKSAGAMSEVVSSIKGQVKFRTHNLQDHPAGLGRFDLVYLRNVAIYFAPDFKKELFDRIADVLNPGGLLCLGVSETVSGYSTRFRPQTYGRAVFHSLIPRASPALQGFAVGGRS